MKKFILTFWLKSSRGRARCANAKDGRMDTHGQDDGSRGTETQQDRRWQLPSPLSRRAAVEATSAAACAKKGVSGRMQPPAENWYRSLAILWCGVQASESSGKLLHFGKIPKKVGQNLAKI